MAPQSNAQDTLEFHHESIHMNPYKTNNPRRAKQALMLQVMEDYNPSIVRVEPSKSRSSWEAEFAEADGPFDIGMPADWTPVTALKFALIDAAQQWMFWRYTEENGYMRYAIGKKSGAILMTEALAQHLPPFLDYNCGSNAMRNIEAALIAFPEGGARVQMLHDLRYAELDNLVQAIIDEQRVTVHQASVLAENWKYAFADPYLKKAQLGLWMFASWLNLHEKALPIDTSDLTVFADYQVPRVMEAVGFITYNKQLKEAIDLQVLIPKDSVTERAIRSATILAGDQISATYNVPATVVDKFLWLRRNDCTSLHHLTVTTRY